MNIEYRDVKDFTEKDLEDLFFSELCKRKFNLRIN